MTPDGADKLVELCKAPEGESVPLLDHFHAHILRLLGRTADTGLPDGTDLYAVAYRPVVRDSVEQVEMWPTALAIGSDLPTLPLALNADLCLPIDLEATYTAACNRRRLG